MDYYTNYHPFDSEREEYVRIEPVSTTRGIKFAVDASLYGKDGIWTGICSDGTGVYFETMRDAINAVLEVTERNAYTGEGYECDINRCAAEISD